MKILVTNHWLKKLGGSETFTYTLVAELKKRGYEIDVLTFQQGIVSERIRKDFGIKILSTAKSSYDLILANHNTCVKEACGNGPIIQTCHGTVITSYSIHYTKLYELIRMKDQYRIIPTAFIRQAIAEKIARDLPLLKAKRERIRLPF